MKLKRFIILIAALLVAALLVLPVALAPRNPAKSPQLLAQAAPASGFARASPGYKPTFPQDFGPHPEFQSEWWYYTGNVTTGVGRHFGYQLTFFRRALLPEHLRQDRPSSWATDQVYMAHFALTNVANRRFLAFERFARGAAGLAGAQASPYRVWLEDWSVIEEGPQTRRVQVVQGEVAFDLLLHDDKGPITHGDRGYSQKGQEPGNASYYYSLTRLATSGSVRIGQTTYQVSGFSWMDHEWSTSALSSDQVGWDWFALQLDDGSEIMLFHLRKADGSIDLFSSGTVIAADGSSRSLARDDFTIRSDATWRSPRSGAIYPAIWEVRIPSLDLSLTIEPYLADQELNVSFTYWEGAVRLSGQRAGRAVRGQGYVEMTGYAASMQGQF